MKGYWCDKCKGFVVPVIGHFNHPHLGERTAYICPKDSNLVYPKELEELV